MGNVIVIIILVLIIGSALRGAWKHMKGEGGCCGGGGELKIKGEKLEHVDGSKLVKIEGMTCEQCKKRVENALNGLGHVNAKVNLKKQEATIKYRGQLSDDEIYETIRKRGYKVKMIKNL